MVQHFIVGLIVFAAVFYSLWLLIPAAARRAASVRLASLARRCGLGEQEAQRLQATLATHSSCGECDSCKGCAAAPMTEQRVLVIPRHTGNGSPVHWRAE